MRILLTVFVYALAFSQCLADDAVLWSSSNDVSKTSVAELISDSSVILALDDFTLGSFTKAAHAYSHNADNQQESAVIAAIRSAKSYAAQDISSLTVPSSATVLHASTWEKLNEQFSALDLTPGYTGILVDAATLTTIREKRDALNDDVDFGEDEASRPKSTNAKNADTSSPSNLVVGGSLPVVVPRYGDKENFSVSTGSSCMLYIENVTIVVLSTQTIGGVQKAYTVPLGSKSGDSYKYAYDCDTVKNFNTSKPFSFTIEYTVSDDYKNVGNKPESVTVKKQTFTTTLVFNSFDGFSLSNATVNGLSVSPGTTPDFLTDTAKVDGSAIRVNAVPFRAYYGHNFACGQSQAIFFNSTVNNVYVGVSFDNIQIQGSGIAADKSSPIPQFTRITADCVGTFSPGSWMGIVIAITLASVLMFGFLMLNSVQTMDRFDDPKQKQIVINFKE